MLKTYCNLHHGSLQPASAPAEVAEVEFSAGVGAYLRHATCIKFSALGIGMALD